MKDQRLNIKVTETWKNRLKKGAEYLCINASQFVIEAVNEKLDRIGEGIKRGEG